MDFKMLIIYRIYCQWQHESLENKVVKKIRKTGNMQRKDIEKAENKEK